MRVVSIVVAFMCAAADADVADLIFHGGDIVTVDDDRPSAEAVAVKDGRVVAVGDMADVTKWKGSQTRLVDLQGRALLPGFIDAHGHLTMTARQLGAANVASPPVGPARDIDELKAVLTSYMDSNPPKPGDWVVGVGYDDSLLTERRHPTRFDLDMVSTEHPIFLLHVSAHLGTCNSLALERFGVTDQTENPPGGVIRRVDGSNEPNGVLEEHALARLAYPKLPQASLQQRLALLQRAQELYFSFGTTTVQDGATRPADLDLLLAAAQAGKLKLDVIAYPLWTSAERMLGHQPPGHYVSHLKIGGVKMVLDGSPQGKTAWLTEPFYVPPDGQPAGYRGYPAMSDREAEQFASRFFEKGWQLLAHANGDAAGDQLIRAVEHALAEHPNQDHRTVMIHAQMVRDDQLERMRQLGITPSFFSAHTFYWGDWHRDSVMGTRRAYRMSPAKSAINRQMRFTIHNDAPIVPPDMLRLIWAAVNRRSRSGDIIGPLQRIDVIDAIKAVTIHAAYQYFEEDTKGSIEVGKLADLVVLSENPLDVDPMAIKDIQVEQTYARGAVVYSIKER